MTESFDERNAEKSRMVCEAMARAAGGARRMSRRENDTVASPAHYTQGGVECIEGIRAALTPEEYRGYLRGNVLKYAWRCELKGGAEDLRKARAYLDWLIGEMEGV